MNKTPEYSIGIVTYHARFETYFKPLIKKLVSVFPDKQIICIANGHPDKDIQIPYLKKYVDFLSTFENIKYITYEQNQSLAKCWNHVLIHSNNEGCLMLNDDTQVSEIFREEFENKIINKNLPFTTINGSWSHFYITKNIIKQIGWFDENLLGIGYEDADTMFRMVKLNEGKITDTECLGIKNYVAPAENPSWKNISKVVKGKYSSINEEYIMKKYYISDLNPEIDNFDNYIEWKGGKILFSNRDDNKTDFYPYSFIDFEGLNSVNAYKEKSLLKINIQKIFYISISFLKKIIK